jgi:hypothetical protein
MGLFSFLKGKKMFDKSLMMMMCVFADVNPSGAAQVGQSPVPAGKALFEKHAVELIKAHYYWDFRPPVKWNYNFFAIAYPHPPKNLQHMIFWDADTGRIVNQAAYRQMCSDLREIWKDKLIQMYPKYDRKKLEDGFENIQYDYYPEDGLLIASIVLEKILPLQ